MERKGKYILFEGTDCSGKQTQSSLTEKRLKEEGYDVVRFSFPFYDTPTGKIVSDYLGRNSEGKSIFEEGAVNVDPYVASLIFAMDRKYNMPKTYKYIEKGYIVILDRYISSNMAHQGSKIDDKDERIKLYQTLASIEYDNLNLPKPDITIFLHMPYKQACILKQNRDITDEHEKSKDHLLKSEQAYLELSKMFNWEQIECVNDDKIRSVEEINEEVYTKVKSLIRKR